MHFTYRARLGPTVLAAFGLAALAVSPACAQNANTPIYNFQFEANGSGAATGYVGTGALGYGGTTFNHVLNAQNASWTFSNAVDSFGAASNVALTVSGPNQYAWNSGPSSPTAAQTLLSQYLYSSWTSTVGTFKLTNLTANTTYKLYLYGGDGFAEPKGTAFSVTGGTADGGISTLTAGQNTFFQEGVNYVLFTGLTDATGSVTGTYQQKSASTVDPFSGLQINLGAADAVTPEGDSLLLVSSGLLPLAGFGLWHRRRRRRKA